MKAKTFNLYAGGSYLVSVAAVGDEPEADPPVVGQHPEVICWCGRFFLRRLPGLQHNGACYDETFPLNATPANA